VVRRRERVVSVFLVFPVLFFFCRAEPPPTTSASITGSTGFQLLFTACMICQCFPMLCGFISWSPKQSAQFAVFIKLLPFVTNIMQSRQLLISPSLEYFLKTSFCASGLSTMRFNTFSILCNIIL
jgi:hypothetical protein